MGVLWEYLGSTLGILWGYFGNTLGALLDYVGNTLGVLLWPRGEAGDNCFVTFGNHTGDNPGGALGMLLLFFQGPRCARLAVHKGGLETLVL